MKLFICICFIVVVIGPGVGAKSFDFSNFFSGSNKKALDSNSAIRHAAPQKNIFDSLDYSTETESDVFNSSPEDFSDFDYQNSSADTLEVSNRNDSNNPPETSDNATAVATAEEEVVQNNETHSSDNHKTTESASPTVTSEKTTTTTPAEIPAAANVSSESPNSISTEEEEVVLGTTAGATSVVITKSIFQKSIDWMEDTYTLSILIPIAAGVLFATAIIVTVALCRCLRRCCRRRRFKRQPLPDSVKSLRPSDRARLLGDTSDEEF